MNRSITVEGLLKSRADGASWATAIVSGDLPGNIGLGTKVSIEIALDRIRRSPELRELWQTGP